MSLVLASTSRYRRELLQRLGLPFDCARPEVDETPLNNEAPLALPPAGRHQGGRGGVSASRRVGDRLGPVADLNGQPLGKPGTVEAACAQLAAMSGQTVHFHTAVCLSRDGASFTATDLTEVRFRALEPDEIARYVATEQPLDCAGSFKCEGLGISLFDAIDNRDPTALIGLPLITLCGLLRRAGFAVP